MADPAPAAGRDTREDTAGGARGGSDDSTAGAQGGSDGTTAGAQGTAEDTTAGRAVPPDSGAGVDKLVSRAASGDPRALARLMTLIENAAPQLRPVMTALAPLATGVRVIGLTGSPGVGKSTITGALVKHYRGEGLRVGVIAVDPSSPFTGGALLGDRIRMQDHATDDGVFIRSMASRGHLGGLAVATPQAVRVLDAAGFGVILVETVGVGQAEVEIASLADSTLVLVAPGMGDAIQAAKAGILEVADVFAVNKADRPQAQQAVRDLRNMIALGHPGDHPGGWKPPIVATVASAGEGIGELAGKLDAHWDWLGESGERERRRLARAREEVAGIAVAALRNRMTRLPEGLDELAGQVADGKLDPFTAADQLVGTLTAD